MVSFWPWKGDSSSAASFEKALRSLSEKISKTSAKNDSLRKNERYNKVWWTLSTGFTYIIAALILILVTGYRNWGIVEYSLLAGGPLVIYGVRTALSAYYNYRITTTQDHLNDLHKQRDETIKKLKAATKYDSTQQLLDKYGGSQPKQQKSSPSSKPKRQSTGLQGNNGARQPSRTNLPPPPTANIPRADTFPAQTPPRSGPAPQPQTPSAANSPPSHPSPSESCPGSPSSPSPSASFAPNAFTSSASQQYSYPPSRSAWYDRLMDVLLGEDETQPRNRLALICGSCRLVNGQAPPGVKTMGEVGRWRCGGCGAWNGEVGGVEGMLGRLKAEKGRGGREELEEDGEGEGEEEEIGGVLKTAPADVPTDWVEGKGRKPMSEEEMREAARLAGEDEERARQEMSFEDRKELGLLDREVGDEDDDDGGKAFEEPPAKATRSRKKKA
ncbi:hypothetical protein EV356DRAFT_286012 [Viridothelium virens]|uniref:Endoplasmic reticulum junction formation protein lunapark n=1 Tax=Viridothelium virens TaxID=1048519 RepID=A0A6A6H0T8_VIRVR|nr:hypothetical protein EV356DRAFT_286012 [Viridothelium virens]